MKNENVHIELIEKYLEGQISKKDKKNFEDRLRSDSAFKSLFEDVRGLIKGIRYAAHNNLLYKLKETEKSLSPVQRFQKPKTVRFKRFKYAVAVAATIVLLLGSIFAIIISRSQTGKEDYFMKYYAPYPNIIHPVQRAEETQMTREELAYYYYESEQYDKALELFLELQEETDNSESTRFYLANIYMAMGNYDDAIENFTILLNDSVLFENQTRWYLGLCYLEDGDLEAAGEQLEAITETENSYKDKAEELLNKIKKQK
jgi:tetratricopeptide (TPR) repeat protein